MRFTRFLLPIVVILVTGCATQPRVTFSQKEVFDVLEVAVRSRLATMLLPRHSRCYVFIENTDVAIAPFAGRFPEYQMIVKRNSPGNSPPPRWFYIRIGLTTHDDAWVVVADAAGDMGYHLRRKGGQWVVIFAQRPVII
jgi:hypothetical protein